uniref:Receptor ligand binding region domain-containing protein n=1 Tax=Panagrolaimus davidi TaxID=227884 RepID=A0A914QLF6_9BILA
MGVKFIKAKCQNPIEIKVGILIPLTDSSLLRDVGYPTSIGAIPLAIDRIVEEQLLSGYNFTFEVYHDECDDASAVGFASVLFEDFNADVIFGPTCNSPATLVGSLGNFYNKPIFTWGLVNSYLLSDAEKYPTISTIIGNSYNLGQSLIAVMRQFKWTQFAMIYSTTDSQHRCRYIKDDIEDVVTNDDEIYISYQRSLTITTLDNIKVALNTIKTRARIIVACFESDRDKRNFLIALSELSMNTNDYVSILVDLRGLGFGTQLVGGSEIGSDIDTVSGTTALWVQSGIYNSMDGKNDVAKDGTRSVFTLDVLGDTTADGETMENFAHGVISRAQGWPFYCSNCTEKNYNASTYARHLHDSFYLYALALNRTIAQNSTNSLKNGAEIIRNTRGTFKGATGNVRIGFNGTRDSTFGLTGLLPDKRSAVFLTISFDNGEGILKTNYTDPTTSIWAIRNGKQPFDEPKCGFDGLGCPEEFWGIYGIYVIIAIVIAVIFLAVIIIYGI